MQHLSVAIQDHVWKSEKERQLHYQSLKNEYDDEPGGEDLWINRTATFRIPSTKAIFKRPEWKIVKNLASIPHKCLPDSFFTEEEKVAKRGKYDPEIYQNKKGEICSECNQPVAIRSHFTRRYECKLVGNLSSSIMSNSPLF